MKVRIIKAPGSTHLSQRWDVEIKCWYWPFWEYRTSALGDNAKKRALVLAQEILSPEIIYVKKGTKP